MDFSDIEVDNTFEDVIKQIKVFFFEKYVNQPATSVYIRFTARSRPRNQKYIDKQAFEYFLQSLGIPTEPLKTIHKDLCFKNKLSNSQEFINSKEQNNDISISNSQQISLFEQIYKAFDKDNDGLISCSDFTETLEVIKSEIMLRLKVKNINNNTSNLNGKSKICQNNKSQFKLRQTSKDLNFAHSPSQQAETAEVKMKTVQVYEADSRGRNNKLSFLKKNQSTQENKVKDDQLIKILCGSLAQTIYDRSDNNEQVRSSQADIMMKLKRSDMFRQGLVSMDNFIKIVKSYDIYVEGLVDQDTQEFEVLHDMRDQHKNLMIPLAEIKRQLNFAVNQCISSDGDGKVNGFNIRKKLNRSREMRKANEKEQKRKKYEELMKQSNIQIHKSQQSDENTGDEEGAIDFNKKKQSIMQIIINNRETNKSYIDELNQQSDEEQITQSKLSFY
ncbi:UNKNOWN [Stylonychia lemnae]|uniref:EF-hand domain-containing protein n=1 Tax=Stylonychia lemnae TaxID=5949 RepID=A0A078ADD3_STYLE|nr:UNKNOWN [Stylonychia lemnae]|eukprot:CDW80254.1 UNKNOWN [Stylonychia lemnae]